MTKPEQPNFIQRIFHRGKVEASSQFVVPRPSQVKALRAEDQQRANDEYAQWMNALQKQEGLKEHAKHTTKYADEHRVEPDVVLTETLKKKESLLTILAHKLRVVKKESLTDELTGLPNERQFKNMFEMGNKRHIKGGLILLDVHNLKEINDYFGGHEQAGDFVLKSTAWHIQENVKKGLNFSARIHGDEFAILVFGVSKDELSKIVDRLGSAFTGRDKEGRLLPTVAIGAAHTDDAVGDDRVNFFQHADDALYQAKHFSEDFPLLKEYNSFLKKEGEWRKYTATCIYNPEGGIPKLSANAVVQNGVI